MPRLGFSVRGMDEAALKELDEFTNVFREQGWEPGHRQNVNRYERYYLDLCAALGVEPWPADPKVVSQLMVAYCMHNKSVATLDALQSAIRVSQRHRDFPEWTKPQEACMAMVKRGLRKKYRAPTKRKLPITLNVLEKLLDGSAWDTDLRAFQFSVMMLVAHDSCLRLKELLALRWSDISWVMGADGSPEAVRIRIRVSKSRYEEAAETLEIPVYHVQGKPMCAVAFLWAYMHDSRALSRRGADMEAFLFPNVRTGQGEQPRQTFVSWVQSRLQACGFDSAEYGGHSFRAGGATDLFKGNAPETVIRMIGRWRSREAYLIYIRLDPSQKAAIVSKAFSQAYFQMCEAALLSSSASSITAACDASER